MSLASNKTEIELPMALLTLRPLSTIRSLLMRR
jgi:hypothetical protein